jgi:hypothetical protein
MNTSSLNTEQLAALQARTSSHNAASGGSLTAQEYLDRCSLAIVDAWVAADFQAAVARLGQAAASLTYEQRLALIAQVEAQLQGGGE